MAGGLFPRLKRWIEREDLRTDDLNAEFDNIITNFKPDKIDDYSQTVSQMRETFDPGDVGTENQPQSTADELKALRFQLDAIIGGAQWYSPPPISLTEVDSIVSGGLGVQSNRLVSGRVDGNNQPMFLVPQGSSNQINLKAAVVNFVSSFNGSQATVSADLSLAGLTVAPAVNNTALVNFSGADGTQFTKLLGEGSLLNIDTIGSEISALNGKLAGFAIGAEYFIAEVDTTLNALKNCTRGGFFDNADASYPRVTVSDNDAITLMRLTWVFLLNTAGVFSLDVSYNQPFYQDEQPGTALAGDYWLKSSTEQWYRYSGVSWETRTANLLGNCLQNTANTIAARSANFFQSFSEKNTVKLSVASANTVQSGIERARVNSYGVEYPVEKNIWSMATDLDSGVTDAANTAYWLYITDQGARKISNVAPQDKTKDLLGYYHPSKPWRCIGEVENDGASALDANTLNWFKYNTNQSEQKISGMLGQYLDFSAGATAPQGTILADGVARSRAKFKRYFDQVGVIYGVGNGTTTFNPPNMARRVKVGAGGTGTATLGNSLGSVGGAETLPAHTHTFTSGNNNSDHTHSGTSDGVSANHRHSYPAASGTTGAGSQGIGSNTYGDDVIASGGGAMQNSTFSTPGGWVGSSLESNGHTHSFTSGTQSANHTHSGTTNSEGTGTHGVIQPSVICTTAIIV